MRILGGTVMAALLLVGGCGQGSYGSSLQTFSSDGDGEKNHVVKLPGGDRFSVGSPDGHRIVAQRYDAGARAWSEPQTIYTEKDRWTHDIVLRQQGGTVAIGIDWWTQRVLDDDYAPEHTVGVVCRDLDCSDPIRAKDLSGTVLTRDGDYAVFGLGGLEYATWDGGSDWKRQRLTGLGQGRRAIQVDGAGAFRALTGERVVGGCVYTLWTGKPHELAVQESGRTPVQPEAQRDCVPTIQGDGDDRVEAFIETLEGGVEFVRKDGTWSVVTPPPSYGDVADTGGQSTMAPILSTPGGDGDQVVLYSPDLRHVYSQSRGGTPQWSKPRLAFTVPDGWVCRRGTITGSFNESYDARLDCWRGDGGPDGTPDANLALLSFNGNVWQGALVHDAGRSAANIDQVLFAGRPGVVVSWPTGTSAEMKLPFPDPTGDLLELSGKRVLRVDASVVDGACVISAFSAQTPTDAAWSTPATFAGPPGSTCPPLELVPKFTDDARIAIRTVSLSDGWRAQVALRDGVWQQVG